jgi:curved DNA-binding protein CbpA
MDGFSVRGTLRTRSKLPAGALHRQECPRISRKRNPFTNAQFLHATISRRDPEPSRTMSTLYDTLDVNEHASPDELKRAYRKAMMKWHPDRNAGNEAAAHAAFQEVRAAYAILSDPRQRREYDAIFAAEMKRWAREQATEERTRSAGQAPAPESDRASGAQPDGQRPGATGRTESAQEASAGDGTQRAQSDQARQARTGHDERKARADARNQTEAEAEAATRYAERVAIAMRYAGEGYNRDVVFGVLLGRQCDVLEAQRIADSVSAWHTAPSAAAPAPAPAPAASATARDSTSEAEVGAAEPSAGAAASAKNDDHSSAGPTPASATAAAPRGPRRRARPDPTGKRQADDAPATNAASDPTSSAAGTDPAQGPATPGHVFGTLWYHFLNGLRP